MLLFSISRKVKSILLMLMETSRMDLDEALCSLEDTCVNLCHPWLMFLDSVKRSAVSVEG